MIKNKLQETRRALVTSAYKESCGQVPNKFQSVIEEKIFVPLWIE